MKTRPTEAPRFVTLDSFHLDQSQDANGGWNASVSAHHESPTSKESLLNLEMSIPKELLIKMRAQIDRVLTNL